MEIAIVGAGWFGCHLALALREEHNITVFEKDEIFSGASGHNQNRLHLGFHYPRSYETRICAMEGYQEFVGIYSDLCETIDTNLYAVADKVSLLDYQTYLHIMDSTGLSYDEVDPKDYGLENVSGCIKVDEKLVLTSKAKKFFSDQITPRYEKFDVEQVNKFDVVLNCSSQVFQSCKDWDLLYEPCLMLNYKCSVDFPAVTIMDGALCTVYPKEDDIYTLYSVEHSPRREMTSYYRSSNQEATSGDIKRFEEVVKTYVPHFKDVFAYCGYENSLRVTFNDNTDLRVPKISVDGKVIHILPSKIDNIFYAEREIKKLLQS